MHTTRYASGLTAIILVNYNNYNDTIECLESIIRLDDSAFVVVVVDNNSTNESCAHIKRWIREKHKGKCSESAHPEKFLESIAIPFSYVSYSFKDFNFTLRDSFPCSKMQEHMLGVLRVQYPLVIIECDKNLGFGGGNNVGVIFSLERIKPSFLWFLNNDTVVDSHALLALTKTWDDHDNVGGCGSLTLYYDNHGLVQCVGGADLKYGYTENLYDKKNASLFLNADDCEIKGYVNGSSFFVSRNVIEKVGLWDESFFMTMEDVDYSHRIKKQGYLLVCSMKSIIYHKEGASTKRCCDEKLFFGRKTRRVKFESFPIVGYYNYRNFICFFRKHYNFFKYVFFLFYFFIGNFIIIMLLDKNKFKKWLLFIKAFCDGIFGRLGFRKF